MLCSLLFLCILPLPIFPAQPPAAEEMAIVLTWYDPARCENGTPGGRINCDSDSAHMATMTPVTPELYGVAAACIADWLGRWVVIEGYGRLHCLDTGGLIRPFYSAAHGRWVIPVDALLHSEPVENYWIFERWRIE